jgi:hypothetical protein
MMTEPEAWRYIALRIVEGRWCKIGLCYETYELFDAERIEVRTWLSMKKRVARHLLGLGESGEFAYPMGTKPEARALAALWLALEAEEDA